MFAEFLGVAQHEGDISQGLPAILGFCKWPGDEARFRLLRQSPESRQEQCLDALLIAAPAANQYLRFGSSPRGGQVLMLVPEINLTPQLADRVRRKLHKAPHPRKLAYRYIPIDTWLKLAASALGTLEPMRMKTNRLIKNRRRRMIPL